jgi:nucleotide-binding universal stress UspA family protein
VRILAAVDVHDQPEPVVDRIVPWAQRLGATVDLCYASQWSTEGLPRPPNPGDELDLLWGEWAKRAEVERTQLRALLARLPDGVRGADRLLAGPPGDVLADAAQGYDLVCVVNHQRTALSRLVNGSVSARVIRSCLVPVLVLGLTDPIPDPAEALYVLAPIDAHDEGALPWIAKHLPLHRTEMVHVRTDGAPVWVPGPPRTMFAPLPADTLRAQLADRARAAGFPGVPLHLVEGEANAGDAVARTAKQLGVDLVVMPTHGRRGLTRLALGSVSERVIAQAHCAVLVVPWAVHAG